MKDLITKQDLGRFMIVGDGPKAPKGNTKSPTKKTKTTSTPKKKKK